MFLANYICKYGWTIFAVQRERHIRSSLLGFIFNSYCTYLNLKGPLTHPSEHAYPCCIPTLGEFSAVMPREGSGVRIVVTPIPLASRERSRQEDSHSGRVRTLGKRVKGNLSRVQIPHSPRDHKYGDPPIEKLNFHPDVFSLKEFVNAIEATFATKPTLLYSTKWCGGI